MIGKVVVTMILRTAAYFVGYTFSIIHLCKKKNFHRVVTICFGLVWMYFLEFVYNENVLKALFQII